MTTNDSVKAQLKPKLYVLRFYGAVNQSGHVKRGQLT